MTEQKNVPNCFEPVCFPLLAEGLHVYVQAFLQCSSSLQLCLWLYFFFAQGLKASQRQEIRAFLRIPSVYVLLDAQDYVRPFQSSLWTMDFQDLSFKFFD